jgi:hypothetical protein
LFLLFFFLFFRYQEFRMRNSDTVPPTISACMGYHMTPALSLIGPQKYQEGLNQEEVNRKEFKIGKRSDSCRKTDVECNISHCQFCRVLESGPTTINPK